MLEKQKTMKLLRAAGKIYFYFLYVREEREQNIRRKNEGSSNNIRWWGRE